MIIYKATNKIDGKCYIGQTTGLLKNRINRHVLDSKKKNNIYFHNAIIKYGSDNFKWCILEFCYSLEELNEKEQWYIKHYNSFGDNGYNMTTGGEKCIFSDEVKKRLSEQRKGRVPWNKGKKTGELSDEHKEKLSLSTKGKEKPWFKGKKLTEEHKQKLKEKRKYRIYTKETKQKMSESAKNRKRNKKGHFVK